MAERPKIRKVLIQYSTVQHRAVVEIGKKVSYRAVYSEGPPYNTIHTRVHIHVIYIYIYIYIYILYTVHIILYL
jgi:hypothetical protein